MEKPDIQKLEENRIAEKLSVRKFCIKYSLVYVTYLYHLRKFREKSRPRSEPGFIELAPDSSAAPFVLHFQSGIKLSVEPNFEPLSLRRLIATLSA